MALIWHKKAAGNRYEVRTHGASVRLYSNGVFHSQWNDRDPLKGSLWELLLLPVFFVPAAAIRRVLLLGVGGGALIRLLQRYVAPESIVGVDIDRHHLTVARRFFGVTRAELIHADAREFVAEYLTAAQLPGRGVGGFDLVIDDLFGHVDGEASRAIEADEGWCSSLLALTHRHGLVVSNFGSRKELLASGWRKPVIRAQLGNSWTAEHPEYENCIGVFSAQPLGRKTLLQQAPPELNPRNPQRRLDSRLRPLR
ncbi:class I SAM-dependent methyltransferase [Microbulbifer sp.]|uniref:class I SAM-dependent methyltransferase n=1 Tax=Microbulbifer sp. TaxID=1908541 RepID=UPI00258FFCD2|nr:class I SAM-dependent methyltransferase [Microbulbifer sp.]